MKYRKKPVVIEAIRWNGTNVRAVLAFCRPLVVANGASDEPSLAFSGRSRIEPDKNKVLIRTLEGVMAVSAGDWIIRGVQGEFYPCRDDIFRATYEPADETEEHVPLTDCTCNCGPNDCGHHPDCPMRATEG